MTTSQTTEAPICASPEEIRQILQQTRTIAVVGCSPKPEKESHQVARYLQEAGYRIIPIYPKGEEILGEKVYRSLREIPEKVDLVDIFRKSEHLPAIFDEALSRGDVDCIWAQLGLYHNAAARKALAAGVKVVQDRCTKVEHHRAGL